MGLRKVESLEQWKGSLKAATMDCLKVSHWEVLKATDWETATAHQTEMHWETGMAHRRGHCSGIGRDCLRVLLKGTH